MRRAAAAMLAATILAAAAPAIAANLGVAKTATVVADPTGALLPRAIPGSDIEYLVTISNPNGVLSGTTVRALVIADSLPAGVRLRVDDYGAAGSGPIDFDGGGLVGIGASGLSYVFRGLGDLTDGVQFFDGTSWDYAPVPVAGFDPKVRAIRVTLTGTHAPATSARLRFRVRVN